MGDVATKPAALAAGVELELEKFRSELTGYCYRMLGSGFEAEDAVQETLVRAWKAYDKFEGRSALRSWLYRIATNVCLDMMSSSQRRARPMDLGPASTSSAMPAAPLPEPTWLLPVPDARVVGGAIRPRSPHPRLHPAGVRGRAATPRAAPAGRAHPA